MKKIMLLAANILIMPIVLIGCTKESPKEIQEVPAEAKVPAKTDAVSAASIVDSASGFLKAISSDGTWIIAVTQDLTIEENLILDGSFTNRGEPARKIALYSQDEDRNVTARYTLTAPRLTVRSPSARIQGGTFVGDVYVEADNFLLIDARIDGNLYFASEEYMASFKQENDADVTGEISVQE